MLRETFWIYRRHFRVWLAQPINLISTVFFSAFFFLLFGEPLKGVTRLPGFPAENYQAFLTAMVLVQAVIFSGADAGFAMLTDILSGYFDKLLLAPIHRSAILFSSLLMAATKAFIQAVVIVVIAIVLGAKFQTGVLGIAAVVFLVSLFGFAWSSLGLMIALKTKNAQITQNTWVLFFPLAFVTPAFMPVEMLTGWFKVAATLNPVSYALDGIRTIIITGWDWGPILMGLWVLLALTFCLTAGAILLYRRATV